MIPNILRKLVQKEKGLALVLVAAAMTVILGFVALVVDIGALYLTRSRLVNACDAAALAGAREFPNGDPEGVAEQYLLKNNITEEEIANKVQIETNNNESSITVQASRDVNYTFARVLGFTSQNVNATATAQYGSITSASGVAPFGIPDNLELRFGQPYLLKEGAGGGEGTFRIHGNFGCLAPGDSRGANDYENNIKEGFCGTIAIGDWVDTEPGNMSGPTQKGIEYLLERCTHDCTPDNFVPGCDRVLLLPVYNHDADGNGQDDYLQGRDQVLIVGFALFLLENIPGNGKNSEVYGTFLQSAPPPDVSCEIDPDAPDYGLHAAKLID